MDKVEYWALNIIHLKIQFCPKDSLKVPVCHLIFVIGCLLNSKLEH